MMRHRMLNLSFWEVQSELGQVFEQDVQDCQQKLQIGVFQGEETQAILNVICQMMTFQPEEQLAIEEALESEWMIKWVLPGLKSCELYHAGIQSRPSPINCQSAIVFLEIHTHYT